MSQPLVEISEPEPAAAFTRMAERIKHNSGQPFGGAVVIYPPANGGAPVEFLLLDDHADIAQFWATAQARIKMEVEDLDAKSRGQQGFPMRAR